MKVLLYTLTVLFVCLLSFWVGVGLELVFQTETEITHRHKLDGSCDRIIPFDPDNNETTLGGQELCAIQTHALSTATDKQTNKNRYKLAFVEFNETRNSLAEPKQFEALEKLLNTPGPKYVIVFVHGWRHDAQIGNGDVARFRTLLAYSRMFLNYRNSSLSDAELIGVYVGWRGRSFAEPTERSSDVESAIWSLLTAPSLYERKRQSENHSVLLIDTLTKLENLLDLKKNGSGSDRMLVVGHSLGGNMIATGLLDTAKKEVAQHKTGEEMPPLLGDLVLLINPASEASKWTEIQRELRNKGKVSGKFSKEAPPRDWYAMFPIHQRPHYVSVTSACEWAENELRDREKPSCDYATRTLFPLAYFFRTKEERTALGHLIPDYPTESPYWQAFPYGSTHEILTNEGAGFATRYKNIMEPRLSLCLDGPGWLRRARDRDQGWSGWDTAYSPEGPDNLLYVRNVVGANEGSAHSSAISVQLRNSLWLPGLTSPRRSVSPGNSPFWNIRAFESTSNNHGSYVNYPFWCTVNQLVLDNIVD